MILPSRLPADAILDGQDAHLAVLDRSGTIIMVNTAWRAFAVANSGAPGRTGEGVNYLAVCDRAVDCSDAAQVAAGIRAVLAGQPHFEWTYTCHGPGQLRWFQVRVRPAGDGAAGCVVVAHENVTRHQLSEEMAAYLAALMASSSDAIIGLAHDSTIAAWHAGAARLYGYSSAEAVGRPIGMLSVPGEPEEEPGIRARLLRGESVVDLDTVRRHKDGSVLPVSVSVSPIRDGSGAIVGAVAIHRDIGARKAAERAPCARQGRPGGAAPRGAGRHRLRP
jgi:PAS domain S-box-containing protein